MAAPTRYVEPSLIRGVIIGPLKLAESSHWFGGGGYVPSASMALQLGAQWLATFALW